MRVKRETFFNEDCCSYQISSLAFVVEIDCKFYEQKEKKRHKNIGPFFPIL